MSTITKSYEKVNYLLRPAKQVERKLFIEGLHVLAKAAAYDFSNYAYVGFGSIYFADFILFHKYLYINEMICLEHDPTIKNRMMFNRPYDFIDVKICDAQEALRELNREKQYIVWLDYDRRLDRGILHDVNAYCRFLPGGSLLIVTVDARRVRPELAKTKGGQGRRPRVFQTYYNTEFRGYLHDEIKPKDIRQEDLSNFYHSVLNRCISDSVKERVEGLVFCPLFNLRYEDTATMLSVGGLICTEDKSRELNASALLNHQSLVSRSNLTSITLPLLTLKEKTFLDGMIQKISDGLKPDDFEIDEQALLNYQHYYKYYPCYHEALL